MLNLLTWQVQACAWLGHWYAEVAQDLHKAKNCYEQTLLMDPSDAVIANRLKQVRHSSWRHASSEPLVHIASRSRSCSD